MRVNDRVTTLGQNPTHSFGVGMGDIDDHAQTVHLFEYITAERRETTVLRRLGLDIPELVDAVVDELQDPEPPAVKKLHARKVALQRICAFMRQDGAGHPFFLQGDYLGR